MEKEENNNEVWLRVGDIHKLDLNLDGTQHELYVCIKDFEILQTLQELGIDDSILFRTLEEAAAFNRYVNQKFVLHGFLKPYIPPKE